uniref:H(+)/Cl(-) exchange transporter 7 n=1 Tax=Bactrocera latifrons TaxID=174628 RepID=A0A0K8VLC3_BACLA
MKKADDVEHLIDIDSSQDEDDISLHKSKPTKVWKSKDDAHKGMQEQETEDDDDEPLAIHPRGAEPTSSGSHRGGQEPPGADTNTISIPSENNSLRSTHNLEAHEGRANGTHTEPTFYIRSRTNTLNTTALKDDVYESLDYDVCDNVLFKEDQKFSDNARFNIRKDILRWIIFIQIGVVTALIACVIDIPIEELSAVKYTFLKNCTNNNF